MPRLIPNASLLPTNVPAFSVRDLDPEGFNEGGGTSGPQWAELWDFALTFDGYRYFGGDDGAALRLDAFATSVSTAFRQDQILPAIDLALLRACLFYEQRSWCKHSLETRCAPELADYLDALLNAIRRSID